MKDIIKLDKYLKELEFLVNIDSGSYYCKGVNRIAGFFEKAYTEIGWQVKKIHFDDSIGTCLEIRNTNKENIDILLIGHMDTVFCEGTAEKRPFSKINDRAYGPGVADMKSGLLLMYYVLKTLDLPSMELVPSICVALNCDEEISSKFSNGWIKDLASKSRYALVLEPGRVNGDLVKERKGLIKYNVEISGISAHAGAEPERGVSAVSELAYWIVELDKLTDFKTGTTVNAGIISGGTAANVVAAKSNAVIDLRYRSEEEINVIKNTIDTLSKHAEYKGAKANVQITGFRPPMNTSEKTNVLCELIETIGKRLDICFGWTASGGTSDANITAAEGIPTVDALGPIGGGTHGIGEYIEISSIAPRFKLLRGIVTALSNLES